MRDRSSGILRATAAVLVSLAIALTATSCDFVNRVFNPATSSTISSELFTAVSVEIEGRVLEAESNSVLADVTVQLLETDLATDTETAIGSATTDASGAFSLAALDSEGQVTETTTFSLDIDTKQYRLAAADDEGTYYANNNTLVYSVADATGDSALSYEIVLVPKNPVTQSVVTGRVLNAIDRTGGVADVEITFTDRFDSTSVYSTTTQADNTATSDTDEAGRFSITLPVASYRVVYDGTGVSTDTYTNGFISEYDDIVLKNASANSLGDHYIVPWIPPNEYQVVVQWDNEDENNWYVLGATLDVVASDMMIVNTLGPNAGSVEINPRYSVNPGTGFAKDTTYWPSSVVAGPRTFVERLQNNPLQVAVGGGTAASVIDIEYDDGTRTGSTTTLDVQFRDRIEVTSFYQKSPVSDYPDNLTYYYPFAAAGGTTQNRYPIGVYNLVVRVRDWASSPDGDVERRGIYGSNAQVKLYEGSRFRGAFEIGSFEPNVAESNKWTWDVLFIEVGFTTASPDGPEDVYLRPVPFSSISPNNELWSGPPFLTQVRYGDGAGSLTGTDGYGEITALYYDSDRGLFLGASDGTTHQTISLPFNGATVEANTHTNPVRGIARFEGEMFALTETFGGVGSVVYDGDGNPIVVNTGTAPADTNVIYCNPKRDDQTLVAGAANDLYLYNWTAGTGFQWVAKGLGASPVTDVSPGDGQDICGAVIAGGKVFVHDGTDFVEVPGLAPPTGTGTVVQGGFYGYIDLLPPGTKVFWGVAVDGDDPTIYVNWYDMSDGSTGTSGAVTSAAGAGIDLMGETVYDLATLTQPGERYSGQPVFGTSDGLVVAASSGIGEYDAGTHPNAFDYFELRPYKFAPDNLSAKTIASTYETTFFGTLSNGVITTLGGVF